MARASASGTTVVEAEGPACWAVVLAGGEGARLRDFVRQVLGNERPKQFCRIIGTRSMLRHTWDRAAQMVRPDRIVTVITAGQEPYIAEERGRGVPGTVVVQPENKGTAPGLLLPLLWIARQAGAATVIVLPADHFVWQEALFVGHLQAAAAAAESWPERLVLLGVEADAPETGYGWIAPGRRVGPGSALEVYGVRGFWEKPDRRTADYLLASRCFWNTLVLAGHLSAYLSLAEASIPHVLEPLRAAAACLGTPEEPSMLARAYRRIPPTDFSHTLLAHRPEGLMLLPARGVFWSDWGDPDRIVQTLERFHRRPTWLPAYRPSAAHAPARA